MAFVFPVVGATEWSGGSWMPHTQNHRGRTHAAIDIYAKAGAMIVSPVSGRVKNRGSSNIGGHWVQIEGDNGIVYYFAHMQAPTHLSPGDTVRAGSSLGTVGNSGTARTTKPHLHFSMKRNGVAINPTKFLQDAVLAPDLEFEKTGVPADSHAPPRGVDWQGLYPNLFDGSQEADHEIPPWFLQLEEARRTPEGYHTDDPIKMKAKHAIHASLRGMAAMVRAQGFRSKVEGGDTGIEDIDREEGLTRKTMVKR